MKIDYVGKCLLICDDEAIKIKAGHGKEIKRILVIGDLHLGYDAVLRRGGLQIPLNLFEEIKKDFDEVYDFVSEKYGGLNKIIILGDVKHEFGIILREEWNEIENFLRYLREKCDELVIIEGNHDKILFPILRKLEIVGSDYYLWNGFAFLHGDKDFDDIYDDKIKYWIMGHGHPAIVLKEGIKSEKFKCFLEGDYKIRNGLKKKLKKIIILPSFFPLIEGTDPRDFDLSFAWNFDLKKFNVRIVGSDLEVFDFGKLGKI